MSYVRRKSFKRPLTGRYFVGVLYPDDKDFARKHSIIDSHYLWVRALHDRDIDFDDKPLKPHYHYVFRIPSGNPTSLISVYNRLNVEPEIVYDDDGTTIKEILGTFSVAVNRRGCYRYLLHADDLNKAQYPDEVLESNDPEMLNQCLAACSNDCLDLKVQELIYLIDNSNAFISKRDLILMAAGAGLFSAVRGIPTGYLDAILEEHNKNYVN